jgi:hypothetical protein
MRRKKKQPFFVCVCVFFRGLKGKESEEFIPCMEAHVLLIYGCVYISVMLLEIDSKFN